MTIRPKRRSVEYPNGQTTEQLPQSDSSGIVAGTICRHLDNRLTSRHISGDEALGHPFHRTIESLVFGTWAAIGNLDKNTNQRNLWTCSCLGLEQTGWPLPIV